MIQFSKTKILAQFDKKDLFEELDKLVPNIKSYYVINFVKKLIEYNLSDVEIIECVKHYISVDSSFLINHKKENYIFLYGKVLGEKLFAKHQKNCSDSLKKAYKNGRKASFEHFFPEYYIKKGYTEEEAKEIVKKRKEKAANNSIEQLKLGNRITTTQLQYYLNQGYTEEEAKEKLKQRQNTVSLESFKSKYGEKEGLKRYQERNAKWLKTLDEKPDEEKEKIYKAKVAGFFKAKSSSVSKMETNILNLIEQKLNITIERQFEILYEHRIYKFDGKYNDIVIEFNGDYWHCNPLKYESTYFHPTKKIYAQEIWDFDKFKCEIVAKQYKKFIIWENELNESDKIIERFKLYL